MGHIQGVLSRFRRVAYGGGEIKILNVVLLATSTLSDDNIVLSRHGQFGRSMGVQNT